MVDEVVMEGMIDVVVLDGTGLDVVAGITGAVVAGTEGEELTTGAVAVLLFAVVTPPNGSPETAP